jgi:hypothetical protein
LDTFVSFVAQTNRHLVPDVRLEYACQVKDNCEIYHNFGEYTIPSFSSQLHWNKMKMSAINFGEKFNPSIFSTLDLIHFLEISVRSGVFEARGRELSS